MTKFALLGLALALAIAAPAYASDPVPVTEAPYATKAPDIQLAAEPATSTPAIPPGTYYHQDSSGSGQYGYIRLRAINPPSGTVEIMLHSGKKEFVIGAQAKVVIAGNRMTVTLPSGTRYDLVYDGKALVGTVYGQRTFSVSYKRQ